MKKLLPLVGAVCILVACNQPKQETDATTAPAKPAATEFDTTNLKSCKQALMALASGDVDAFTGNLADNAVYAWNAGDSVAGKAAIVTYWKERRGNVIDKLDILQDIWLGIKVNESLQKGVQPGAYVFGWAKITASYKGGKSMTQWIHNVYHFNASGKIDRVNQFLDRAPIAAAMPAKK